MPKSKIQSHKTTEPRKANHRVIIPASLNGGKKAVRFFSSKVPADRLARELTMRKEAGSLGLLRLNIEDQARLSDIMASVGDDVALVDRLVSRHIQNRPQKDATLEFVAAGCVQSKVEANLSPKYIQNINTVFRRFLTAHEGFKASDVTAKHIRTWLNSNGWSDASRKSYLTDIKTLFKFAVDQGYCVSNPAETVPVPKISKGRPKFLDHNHSRELMDVCRELDPGMVPYFAACLFGGLRPDREARFITWDYITDKHLDVDPAYAKTDERRLVDISPNLRAWLDLGGELPLTNFRRRQQKIRKALSFDWPHDGPRKSFASHYLAQCGSAEKTAYQMGHGSTKILFRNYRAVVTQEDAAKFWGIRP